MYTVHSYYTAILGHVLTIFWIYPVICSLCSFYCYDFGFADAGSLFNYMTCLTIVALSGASLGLCIGAMTSDQTVSLLLVNLLITLANFGAGILSNSGEGANPIIKFLSWVSPMHYAVEIIFSEVTQDRVGQEQMLDHYGYNNTKGGAFAYLIFFVLLLFSVGWAILWLKNRNY